MTLTAGVDTAQVDASGVFSTWLAGFAGSMESGDVKGVTRLVTDDCWWRDLLALTWDLGTFRGPDEVAAMLTAHLPRAAFGAVTMVTEYAPSHQAPEGAEPWVEGFFTFETALAVGRGVARLRLVDGEWRAWSVMTGMEDIRGHERALGARRPIGPRHIPGASTQENWADLRRQETAFATSEPDVVVIGAGQGGLAVAANLGLMGVATLIIEKSERVGDGWRKRYHSLVLHDPVWADHLPYLPFPQSWPIYSAKDKIADWFEFYAAAMELNVWTSTQLLSSDYDETSGRWTIRVRTADGEREIRPKDLILSTGAAGEPNIPDIPGREGFSGTVYHSSGHTSGGDWAGRKAVVVGACNSGHDIAQELYELGADVTMVQRSSTYIMSQQYGIPAIFGGLFHEDGPPTEYADLLSSAYPWPLVLDLAVEQTKAIAEMDAGLLKALDAVGFRRNDGPDGTGLMGYALRNGGGYYIDVGASQLIADRKISLAQGSGVAEFTPTGIRLQDGTALDADLVVLATGYSNMRETARRLFGDGVADKCQPVLGVNPDGELGGLWRRTGQPGLWFMGGPLAWVRIYAKYLALQITADQAGVRSA